MSIDLILDVLKKNIGSYVEIGVDGEINNGTVASINNMTEVHFEAGDTLNLRGLSIQFLSIGATPLAPEANPEDRIATADAIQKAQLLMDTKKSAEVIFNCGFGLLNQLDGEIRAIHNTTVQFEDDSFVNLSNVTVLVLE